MITKEEWETVLTLMGHGSLPGRCALLRLSRKLALLATSNAEGGEQCLPLDIVEKELGSAGVDLEKFRSTLASERSR